MPARLRRGKSIHFRAQLSFSDKCKDNVCTMRIVSPRASIFPRRENIRDMPNAHDIAESELLKDRSDRLEKYLFLPFNVFK